MTLLLLLVGSLPGKMWQLSNSQQILIIASTHFRPCPLAIAGSAPAAYADAELLEGRDEGRHKLVLEVIVPLAGGQ